MVTDGVLERMEEKVVIPDFKVLSWHLCAHTEKNIQNIITLTSGKHYSLIPCTHFGPLAWPASGLLAKIAGKRTVQQIMESADWIRGNDVTRKATNSF
jgi:hypothetical protein